MTQSEYDAENRKINAEYARRIAELALYPASERFERESRIERWLERQADYIDAQFMKDDSPTPRAPVGG